MWEAIERRLDRESTALYGTAQLSEDGIIDPRDTRKILSLYVAIAAGRRRARFASQHIRDCAIVTAAPFVQE